MSAHSTLAGVEAGAYIDATLIVPGSSEGPLKGLTFAVKDLFDVAGHRTGFGNPVWLETHPPATATAAAVEALLQAGATMKGKTVMDELAYSLNGENHHYGTPKNPAANGHVPGGSSSGSAVACACGDVDFALGTDTGGSVRIPASFCGLYGLRPTHGRISTAGAWPLAHSFCTVGYFTRSSSLLKDVGGVLLQKETKKSSKLSRWLVPRDAWDLADASTSQAIFKKLSSSMAAMQVLGGRPHEFDLGWVAAAPATGSGTDGGEGSSGSAAKGSYAELERLGVGKLSDWFDVFRIHQAGEIWETHGAWISENKPEFGPGTRERFKTASGINHQDRLAAAEKRQAIRSHLISILGSDGFLTVPTAPGPAPLCNTPSEQLDEQRRRMLNLLCVAGLGGLPQVSIPIATVDSLPVGLGIIGPPGSDEALLDLAHLLAQGLNLP